MSNICLRAPGNMQDLAAGRRFFSSQRDTKLRNKKTLYLLTHGQHKLKIQIDEIVFPLVVLFWMQLLVFALPKSFFEVVYVCSYSKVT